MYVPPSAQPAPGLVGSRREEVEVPLVGAERPLAIMEACKPGFATKMKCLLCAAGSRALSCGGREAGSLDGAVHWKTPSALRRLTG